MVLGCSLNRCLAGETWTVLTLFSCLMNSVVLTLRTTSEAFRRIHTAVETVTYMLEGYMEHRDHMDNLGRLGPGDVQWMNAGSGVIHSEMPQQKEGRMRGFQLWIICPQLKR